MFTRIAILAATVLLTSLGARAADLVVWWEEGQAAEENGAVREIVAAFEQETGKEVELVLGKYEQLRDETVAAIEAGRRPPDFLFTVIGIRSRDQWAHEGRLVDLADVLGHFGHLFDPDALERGTLVDATGRRGLYALPMGFATHHVHVWRNLLGLADFTLEDVPKQWHAFWSFWCDAVQPAVREALGRDDIWGIGLPMSATSVDTDNAFWQFVQAYEADYVTPYGRVAIDNPEVRRRLIEVIDNYTSIYRKGCTPPDSVTWDGYGNNKEFLAQTIVMTPNQTLSITNALKSKRPHDYYENAATIEWPDGAFGQPLSIYTSVNRANVFEDGGHVASAKEFVRFLVGEGWLAHYLNFAGERMLPPMPALLEAPFWMDPQDPHRMRSAVQLLTRPRFHGYVAITGDWRHGKVYQENVWPNAVHKVAMGELTPEQAVDEAITRIKQILAE